MPKERVNVSIDRELAKKVKTLVSKTRKYRSISHFVEVAVDKLLKEETGEETKQH